MAKLNLAIIGVGLIGGSFGLALKSRLGDDVHITGLCRTQTSMDAAVARGAVDEAAALLPEPCRPTRRMMVGCAPVLSSASAEPMSSSSLS